MSEWLSALSLDDKEYIVKHWGLKDGILVLSNNRVMHLKYDKTKRLYSLDKSITVDSIKSISGSGSLWSQNVYVHTNKESFSFEGIFPKEGVVAGKLPRDDFKELTLEQLRERTSKNKTVVIDFSFLKSFMENGGLVLTAIKSPECRAPVEMPTSGTEVVCKYCKSTIQAVDVFKKVKDLL